MYIAFLAYYNVTIHLMYLLLLLVVVVDAGVNVVDCH